MILLAIALQKEYKFGLFQKRQHIISMHMVRRGETILVATPVEKVLENGESVVLISVRPILRRYWSGVHGARNVMASDNVMASLISA